MKRENKTTWFLNKTHSMSICRYAVDYMYVIMAYWIASCFFSLSMYVITNLAWYHVGQHLSWVVLCLAGYWNFRISHAVLQIWFTASYLKKFTFPMISIFNLNVKSALHASLLADSQKMSMVMYTEGKKEEEEKSCTLWTHSSSFQKKVMGDFFRNMLLSQATVY